MKKFIAVLTAVLMAGAVSVTAFAEESDFGSAAVTEDKTYTLSEMLTYAIEDEYMAYAGYDTIINTFGVQRPFTNIIKAESTHISELEPLFEEYGINLPENSAAEYVMVPDTLLDAFKAGVEAELGNIAMYETFLAQNLPDDVRLVFTELMNASENHLAAFENGVTRLENSSTGANASRGNNSTAANKANNKTSAICDGSGNMTGANGSRRSNSVVANSGNCTANPVCDGSGNMNGVNGNGGRQTGSGTNNCPF